MFHAKWNTQQKDILAHCRWELMHGVWQFLLDDDFLHTYKYGIVMHCYDGIEWHIYPQIFTYSVDYLEKWVWFSFMFVSLSCSLILITGIRVLLATIWDKGLCPCPRCPVPDSKLDQLGLVADAKGRITKVCKYPADSVREAQKVIYKDGKPIRGAAIQQCLKATLTVPTIVS